MRLRVLFVLLAALLLPVIGFPRAARADTGWQWPIRAPHRVVHGYDPPAHDWLPGNRGVDLAVVAGQPVVASGSGTVSFAGRIGAVGVIAVRHPGGLETTYEPVRANVHVGQSVSAGAVLGAVIGRNNRCAPAVCLHWGLRRGSTYLDPLSLVGAGPVRLLPLMSAAGASWLVPAAGGASLGSSAVVVGWAVRLGRRRRRPLPPGVTSLAQARAERNQLVGNDCSECGR